MTHETCHILPLKISFTDYGYAMCLKGKKYVKVYLMDHHEVFSDILLKLGTSRVFQFMLCFSFD